MLALVLVASAATFFVATLSLYLALLVMGAYRHHPASTAGPPLQLAVLVPAHNEAESIATCLQHLRSTEYPESHRQIFVIADNCTDATATLARAHLATVFERSDPENPGKGQAIDWFLRKHMPWEAFDAVVFVDADAIADPRLLSELAGSLRVPGVEVVQGHFRMEVPTAGWRAALAFMSWAVVNRVRPGGRAWLGGTAELKGCGMAFRAPFLRTLGWPTHGVVEDLELTLLLLSKRVLVHFNPDAVVTSRVTTRPEAAEVQHRRWEGGRFAVVAQEVPRLLRSLLRKPNLIELDALLDLLVPPLSLYLAEIALVMLLWLPLGWRASAAAGALLLPVGAAISAAVHLSRAPMRLLGYWAMVPLFLGWKLPLLLKLLLWGGDRTWNRTPRNFQ